MIKTKRFHIGDVLSITTGKLVSPDHMGGIYAILNWMTGESLYTHQIPRACGPCSAELLRQFPELGAVDVPSKMPPDTVAGWLAEQVVKFGETRDVMPLPAGAYEMRNPLVEAMEMKGTPRRHRGKRDGGRTGEI
jgi:hypothetical protein